MDVKELRRLLRLMRDFDLSELEIEEEGSRVRVRRGAEGSANVPIYAAPPAPAIEPVTEEVTDEPDARLLCTPHREYRRSEAHPLWG